MAKRARKVRKQKKAQGFPVIADLVKTVPKEGLLDPELRKGVTGRVPTVEEVFGR